MHIISLKSLVFKMSKVSLTFDVRSVLFASLLGDVNLNEMLAYFLAVFTSYLFDQSFIFGIKMIDFSLCSLC